MDADPRRLTTQEASEYLRRLHGITLSSKTLNKKACVGGGPVFTKVGNRREYTPARLDEYAVLTRSPEYRSTGVVVA